MPIHILTGPPCSGKTTLKESLRNRGYSVIDEIQMSVIAEYQRTLGGEEAWKNWLRPNGTIDKPHFSEFMRKCISIQIQGEMMLSQSEKHVFLDRSILDCITFLELRNIDGIQHDRLKAFSHATKIAYQNIFHLHLLPDEFEKRKQEGRVITIEEARKFDEINRRNYSNFPSYEIDGATPEKRIEQILSYITL